jgi:hypothetical protein
MNIVKSVFSSHICIYVLIFAMAHVFVNYPVVAERRNKYLLGIFYNGHFKNCNDGRVYLDYMKRTSPNDQNYQKFKAACP